MQKRKKIVEPLFHEFKEKDILQVILGASLLAMPIGFTEETWQLGETLPIFNALLLLVLSIVFIGTFTYHHYHRHLDKVHWQEFRKRVIFTYLLSFLVVAVILTIIQKAPWQTDFLIAIKRTLIVTFPCSVSAAFADTLK